MARLYMNIDINSYVCPFLNTVLEQENVYPEMLWPFVDVYRSTQVTDVLFDIFCQLSATPSSHIGTLGELCRWGAGNGIEDSFLDFHHCPCTFILTGNGQSFKAEMFRHRLHCANLFSGINHMIIKRNNRDSRLLVILQLIVNLKTYI